MNPAVTLGFWVAGRFSTNLILPYLASQFTGALLASIVLRWLFPSDSFLGTTQSAGTAVQSFVLETIITAVLMFVILHVSTGAKEKGITAGIANGIHLWRGSRGHCLPVHARRKLLPQYFRLKDPP